MHRALPVVTLLAVLACGRPPGQGTPEDAGPSPAPQCALDGDCPLGTACVEGQCVAPSAADASTGCTADADCPVGERCLRSSGLCVASDDAGAVEPPDAGQAGECFEGQVQTCGSSKLGECRLGTSSCALLDGVFRFGPCVGAVDAVAEACNGKDDDCDGQPDNGLGTLSCGQGECARTVEACVGGAPLTCTPGPSSAEVCDGKDNDCDGQVDEALADLTCGRGECLRTVTACVGGAAQTCTPGAPAAEVCNGKDDDCDGQPDNGLGTATCGQGVCRRVVQACVSGAPVTCSPGPAQTETCNTLDDDCDGSIDEGCACTDGQTQGCYTGSPGTAGVGVCRAGLQTCAGGAWGTCAGQLVDGAETCNGLDDDCDGTPDDGLGTRSCGAGTCARTVAACVNGQPQSCTPGIAGTEVCNGLDDDCDGTPDDGLGTLPCGVGVCATSVAACVNGQPQTCTPGTAGTEVCNGLDDDCDGSTDESYPQQGQACTASAQGLCANGLRACTGGALTCTPAAPLAEVCNNNLDENCNGITDDPIACGCNNTIDRDFDGASECTDCNDLDGTIRPGATEVCNGKDDDCDLLRDEGFDQDNDTFTSCGTVTTGGVDPLRVDCNDTNSFVFPLKLTDCGAAATPTVANGVDDNCNGYADETCRCSTQDKDKDGVSECEGDCNDGNANIKPNWTESCDGLDNDCNTATVDNCGVSQPCGFLAGNTWTRFPAGTDQCRPDLICVSNVSTGALTCGSFCNQTSGTGLNDSCGANEGCFRNLLDSANQHLCSVLTVGTKAAGQPCTADGECRSGDCLTDGTASYCSDKCTHEAGCSASTSCVVQRSDVLGGTPTRDIGDYLYSYCRLDSLLPGTKATGQTCAGSECRAGADACFNGRCVEPCCQHSDCPTGTTCSVAGPKASIGYQSGGAPIVSVVPACVTSSAQRVSGAACAANADCKSGLCERTLNVCVDLCCNDASCPNGTTCEPVSLTLGTGELTTVRACLFAPTPSQIRQK